MKLTTLLFLLGVIIFSAEGSERLSQALREITSYLSGDYLIYRDFNMKKDKINFVIMPYRGQIPPMDTVNASFVLKDQESCYYLNLVGKYLFLDYGTGPDIRTLRVFDVVEKRIVLDKDYYSINFLPEKDSVSIWIESKDTVTSKCPEYKKWQAEGFTTAIIEEAFFNLKTLKLNRTSNRKCMALQ